MNTASRLTFLTFLALGLLVLPAFAQGPPDVMNLERELERTEEMIRQAAELAGAAGNAQAAELVKNAMELQEQARQAFRNGFFEVARIRTTAARTIVAKVMAMLLDPKERADRVESELQRTDDLLAKTREALGPAGPEMARSLLDAAFRQESQAWEQFRAGNHRPALRMTNQVREILTRLRLQMEEFDPNRLEEAFSRTEEIVTKATEAAGSASSRVQELAEQAAHMLQRAHEFASNGQYLAAVHHLTQAQRLAHRALRLAGGQPDNDDYDRLAEQYQASFARIMDLLGQAPNEAAGNLIQESREHFRLSSELYQAGPESQERAFAELNLAMRLLNKAKDLLE